MSEESGHLPPSEFDLKEFLAYRNSLLAEVHPDQLFQSGLDPKHRAWIQALLLEKSLRKKLPSAWFEKGFRCESKKSSEQCSSWSTANYKSQLIDHFNIIYDLTGGLGIDSIAFSSKADELVYFEREEPLSQLAKSNFEALELANIHIENRVAESFSTHALTENSLVYIDPDRRGKSGERVNALDSMSPSWEFIHSLHNLGWDLLVKLSPIQDIKDLLQRTNNQGIVHLLEHERECKEVLLEWKAHEEVSSEIRIHETDGKWKTLNFPAEEVGVQPYSFGFETNGVLLDPSPSVIKSACWQFLAEQFHLRKVASNTHLFYAEVYVEGFPGRQFEITGYFDKKNIPESASVVSKNHFLQANEIRKKWKLKENPEVFLFAFRDQRKKGHLLLSRRLI